MMWKQCARSRCLVLLTIFIAGCFQDRAQKALLSPGPDGAYHVHPGQEIQPALDAAACDELHKTVRVHAGVYRPSSPGQAMVWFNKRHDGITLKADGDVVLTAANKELADPSISSYPAIVNHVIYFGDGISRSTVLQGFKITGANGFFTRSDERGPIETAEGLKRGLFYYLDGGAIKLVGRSCPTVRRVVVEDNVTALCGGGVSIEHQGRSDSGAFFKDCIFKNNRCPATGSAVDVLSGSSVVIENCLFVGNIGNTGMDEVRQKYRLSHNGKHGSGALTVFPGSKARVRNCTFVDNWNGVDDHGAGSAYENCIFWKNSAGDGSRPGGPYEIDILDASGVRNCFLRGDRIDLRSTIDMKNNHFNAPDPQFDQEYRPRGVAYSGVGYRPAEPNFMKESGHVLFDE